MIFIGPINSIYDFLTFWVLIYVFRASEPLFHTGWFVESLATQTLVLFVIRTIAARNAKNKAQQNTVATLLNILISLIPISGPGDFVSGNPPFGIVVPARTRHSTSVGPAVALKIPNGSQKVAVAAAADRSFCNWTVTEAMLFWLP